MGPTYLRQAGRGGAPPVPATRRDLRPIGQLLVESGDLTPRDQLRALALQARASARFGDILLAHGLVGKDRLYRGIARQFGTEVADFDATPPDIRLVEAYGVERCLADGILPWHRRDGVVLVASARPEQFAGLKPGLEALFGPVAMTVTPEADLHRAIMDRHPRRLADRAETRVPADASCRAWPSRLLPRLAMAVCLAAAALLVAAPAVWFVLIAGWAALTLVALMLMKAAAFGAEIAAGRDRRAAAPDAAAPIIARLPTVSLLVPLYKERSIAARLIERLDRLDYPRELLDILLVVEADDRTTCDALDALNLPPRFRQIVVPDGALKTKPRALNFALDFCRGSIVGICDAEDAPAPDQLWTVVRRFHQRGPEVACLQGVLDYYNARSNWLSRCFTIEYAAWFRVLLPGLARLGLPIPLGGTTLFLRRRVLEDIGGWDAHNVTEDADLGIRLARHGYRTELIETVTEEEANCWFWPWIRQRSRWLKGYMVTWAVHTRRPRRLWRDLGPWRFIGFQVLFLGTISQFLAAPAVWSAWLLFAALPHPADGLIPPGAIVAVSALFLAAEALNLAIGAYAVRGPRHRFLVKWVPTLIVYFPFAVIAAYKGALELLSRPFFWDKTQHGRDLGPAPDRG